MKKCFPICHCKETYKNIHVTSYMSKMIVSIQNVFHINKKLLYQSHFQHLFDYIKSLIQNIPKIYHN
jgi:hypothetical protein